jgi:choline kinase
LKLIFLIAGKGSRLNFLTKKKHKALLEINKEPIIRRLVNQFHSLKIKSKDITFITGYKREQIKHEFGKKYNFFYYKDYATTNNLHTLINANRVLENQDTIICFSDILTTYKTISLITDKKISKITILTDLSKIRNGTMKVKVDKKDLKLIGKLPRKKSTGNYIGIMKIPKNKMQIFKKFLMNSKNKNKDNYFTEILNDLIKSNEKINVINIAPNQWMEIDNMIDLKKAIKNINRFNE